MGWDLQAPVFTPEAEVVALVGEYAARALAAQARFAQPGSALRWLRPGPYPLADPGLDGWSCLDGAAAAVARAVELGGPVQLRVGHSFEGAVAAALLHRALEEIGVAVELLQPGKAASLPRPVELVLPGAGVEPIALASRLDHQNDGHLGLNAWKLGRPSLLRSLPEVAVAWRLATAVRTRLGHLPGEAAWADLVFAGCVGGLVSLVHCRELVLAGLTVSNRAGSAGLTALIQGERHQPFRLAARLQALVELDDIRDAVRWLSGVAGEALDARIEAAFKTHQRRVERVIQQAATEVESFDRARAGAVVVAGADWPPVALPLAAARLSSRFSCPVVLLASGDEATQPGRGHGHCTKGTDLTLVLEQVAALVGSGGGRTGAVEFQFDPAHVHVLRRELFRALEGRVARTEARQATAIAIDAETTLDVAAELGQVATQLERLGPYGPGWPRFGVGLRNCRPTWGISRDGRHLDGRLGRHTLRLRDGAEQRGFWQQAGMCDLVVELEPWQAGERWWGWIKHLQPALGRLAPADAPCPGARLEVEDFRGVTGKIPDSLPALVLREWPFSVEELAEQLQRSEFATVVLAGSSRDWSMSQEWAVGLVHDWRQGGRQQCERLKIPTTLVERVFGRAAAAGIARAAAEVLREARAFQRWLDTVPAIQISELCNRLVQQPWLAGQEQAGAGPRS